MVKYPFDIEAKDHRDVMNVCETFSHGYTLMCQMWYHMSKDKKTCLEHEVMLKTKNGKIGHVDLSRVGIKDW